MQKKLRTLIGIIVVCAATLIFNQLHAGPCIKTPCGGGGDGECVCPEDSDDSNSSDNQNDSCESSGGQTSGSTSTIDLSRGGLYYSDTNLEIKSHIPIKSKTCLQQCAYRHEWRGFAHAVLFQPRVELGI